jgi:CRISPR-associated protein Cmr2
MNYTAITIGPVFETMELSSSPAALWGASYLFSSLSRELVQALKKKGVPEKNFIAPYVSSEALSDTNKKVMEDMKGKGVGLYHDRIIFQNESIPGDILTIFQQAKEEAIKRVALLLQPPKKEAEPDENLVSQLTDYFRIYGLVEDVPEETCPLLVLGKKLSALELEPYFVTKQETNPLVTLFKNDTIKTLSMVKGLDEWALYKEMDKPKYGEKGIRDLKDIASQCTPERDINNKYYQYYAVLKSDGDSMSKILEKCTTPEDIQNYSQTCLIFCSQAAKLILDYGGMPIYAGGDDLLAIIPVMGKENSILKLVNDLRKKFNTVFNEYRHKFYTKDKRPAPTLSIGISIQYYKSPLYEALDKAEEMLREAKAGTKNACYMNLRKHSGQSVTLHEEKMDKLQNIKDTSDSPNLYSLLDELYQKTVTLSGDNASERTDKEKENVLFLAHAGFQLEAFKILFSSMVNAEDSTQQKRLLDNLMNNLFDNQEQQKFSAYLDKLKAIIQMILVKKTRLTPTESWNKCSTPFVSFIS